MKNRTTVERKSERERVVTRIFNGPARIVFEAWTKPELLKRWWAPKSTGVSLLSCEADVRVGGRYRFEFGHEASRVMAFFGRYIEVIPHSRLFGEAVGCGAIRTLGPGVGEIKRMWVSPQVRGIGVGGRLLQALEREARRRKLRTVRLDTNGSLVEALRLYRTSGYRDIARYNDNPYAHDWFEKTLS